MHELLEAIMRKKFGITTMLLTLGLLMGMYKPALAVDRDDRCERQVRKAELNLEKAVRRHGEHSRQAEQRRHQLEEARERCHHGDHDRDHDHH
jgi:hypothetical protein